MKHQTVYVPVPAIMALAGEVIESPITMPSDIGLKKVENVNVLTDSELLELKKKWCEEAWYNGKSSIVDCLYIDNNGNPDYYQNSTFLDKQKFLNNLKLD